MKCSEVLTFEEVRAKKHLRHTRTATDERWNKGNIFEKIKSYLCTIYLTQLHLKSPLKIFQFNTGYILYKEPLKCKASVSSQ